MELIAAYMERLTPTKDKKLDSIFPERGKISMRMACKDGTTFDITNVPLGYIEYSRNTENSGMPSLTPMMYQAAPQTRITHVIKFYRDLDRGFIDHLLDDRIEGRRGTQIEVTLWIYLEESFNTQSEKIQTNFSGHVTGVNRFEGLMSRIEILEIQ